MRCSTTITNIDSDNVYYTGQYLPALQINTNTNLTITLQAIDALLSTLPSDFTPYVKRQTVATFADINLTGEERLIVVETDENNSNNRGFYYYKNSQLNWLISQPI